MRKSRGFSLIEVVVTLAILAIVVFVLVVSQREALIRERANRIDYFRHPDQSAVITRLRRDVLDAVDYSGPFLTYRQTEQTLLLVLVDRATRKQRIVVYDFTRSNEATRLEFDAEERTKLSEWTARAVPQYRIDAYEELGRTGVRVRALGRNGELVIDQILVPRA